MSNIKKTKCFSVLPEMKSTQTCGTFLKQCIVLSIIPLVINPLLMNQVIFFFGLRVLKKKKKMKNNKLGFNKYKNHIFNYPHFH